MRFCLLLLCIGAMARSAAATAPTISGVSATPQDTWATAAWTASQSSYAYVDYGPTTSYGTTEATTGSLTTAQKVQLNNLTASTLYHYRVRSKNSSGEIGTSGDYTFTTKPVQYGCEGNPTGQPIGGGVGYSRTIDPATANYVVSTASALKTALSSATSGQVVYVADDAVIDLSSQTSAITIKAGVTLASGRGRNGSLGGRIVYNTFTAHATWALFTTGGTGTRITGLRMIGPWNGRWRTYQEYHGIYVGHANCEIDNNEMVGWNYAALETLLASNACAPNFHHNYVHHNTKLGCGYGICPGFCSGAAVPVIEGNIFDFERHSVAGHGNAGMSYEARYNLILEHSISHVFDMHGGADRDDGTDIAGSIIRIHHNTVRNTDQSAVCIRGIPTVGCWVNNNRLYHVDNSLAIRQINDFGNFWYWDNLYGEPGYPGLIAEWNFEDGSGANVADSSGREHNGVLSAMSYTTSWVPGHTGGGLTFNDTGGSVNCGYNITRLDNIVLDCWVKFDSSMPENQYIISNGVYDLYYRGSWAGNYLFFRYNITGSTYPGDSGWTGYTAVKSTVPIVAGQWYHYTAVRSGNTMTLYTNGALDRTLDCLAGCTVEASAMTNLSLGIGFSGVLDEVSIYAPYTPPADAPTLTWTGEANYTGAGVYPLTGTTGTDLNFRVKYTDPHGIAPMLGYPRLHILREGMEFAYFTPLVMSAADATTVTAGRIYQYQLKLPRGSDYTYYFEARNADGTAATGGATTPAAGPAITSGNSAPVLYYGTNDSTKFIENIMYPSTSGTSNTNFDIRAAYIDIDNDPPQAGYPKVRVYVSGTEIPGSPFQMTQMDTGRFFDKRNYQLVKRFPAGTYDCQIICNDAQGAAANPLLPTANYPTVTDGGTVWTDLVCEAPNPNPSMSFTVKVAFGAAVTGFAASDVTVTNGAVSGVTGSGGFYTFTVTATTQGQATTVTIPAGAVSPTNNAAAATISRVCYPATGGDAIWVGYGYAGALLGTQADPFATMADGLAWVKSGGIINILTGSNPETPRITKQVRLQASGGTAKIGSASGVAP
ncbi:MAG: LamG-like jellyroll fold domain-containing protein [Candidatus Sumerlaeia bacterium]